MEEGEGDCIVQQREERATVLYSRGRRGRLYCAAEEGEDDCTAEEGEGH